MSYAPALHAEHCDCPRCSIDEIDTLDRLEIAIETDTDHGVALALADLINEQLLVRHGEVLTLEVARERANNIAQVIAPTVRR